MHIEILESEEKERFLSLMTEEQLRRVALIPLLRKMGYSGVIEYHGGAGEKGKDIICRYSDPSGKNRYLALVVKQRDIHGSVSKKGNAGEVLLQAEQAFNQPYFDIYDLTQVQMDEVWIVSCGVIKNTALDSISGMLMARNLFRFTRFVDRRALVELIDDHYPSFWYTQSHFLFLIHQLRASLTSAKNKTHWIKNALNNRVPGQECPIELADKILTDLWELGFAAESIYLSMTPLGLNPETLRLSALLGDAVKIFGKRLDSEFEPTLEDDIAVLDRRLTLHGICCVLENCVTYSLTQPSRIQVAVERIENHISIRVRDNGIGVPEEESANIFAPYYRAANAREQVQGRAGLGLSLCRKIFEKQGCKVQLTNHGNPTEFTILINSNMTGTD